MGSGERSREAGGERERRRQHPLSVQSGSFLLPEYLSLFLSLHFSFFFFFFLPPFFLLASLLPLLRLLRIIAGSTNPPSEYLASQLASLMLVPLPHIRILNMCTEEGILCFEKLTILDSRQPIVRTVHHNLARNTTILMDFVRGTSLMGLGTERALLLLDYQTQIRTPWVKGGLAKRKQREKEEEEKRKMKAVECSVSGQGSEVKPHSQAETVGDGGEAKQADKKEAEGGLSKEERLVRWAERLRTIGQICGLDVLIRNTDRIPLVVVGHARRLCCFLCFAGCLSVYLYLCLCVRVCLHVCVCSVSFFFNVIYPMCIRLAVGVMLVPLSFV